MKILGISAWYHDSASCLVVDGELKAAVQEERFTRIKNDLSFPHHSIEYALSSQGLKLEELDAIAFYDKPFLKFERLLETAYATAPRGLGSFVKAMPVWMKEKLFMKRQLGRALKKLGNYNPGEVPLLFPEHHLSHAASAFYPSPFQYAAILTVDGVGEWATASIGHGQGADITVLEELQFPHSIGLLYSAFTGYLGFRVNSGEYKLMGLAPYGIRSSHRVQTFVQQIKETLIDLKSDGSVWLNMDYFPFLTKERMFHAKKWADLFGVPTRTPESELKQIHCDLAAAIQVVTEEAILLLGQHARTLTKSNNLCMAGGVALNCVANGVLLREKVFDQLFVQPAAGDAGGAVGAALAAHHLTFGAERQVQTPDAMHGAYLGPKADAEEIKSLIEVHGGQTLVMEDHADLCSTVSNYLNDGKVVGWVQGRMEFGPRALGNRSILADVRNEEMQRKLNLSIKRRESFRPFAPAVLASDVSNYFEQYNAAPYMTIVQPVKKEHCFDLPAGYSELPPKEKLKVKRSTFPAITHVDGSARIQTVHEATNPEFWQLLQTHKAQYGLGMLVNTSFNRRGEPVVCSAKDAYDCFMDTDMDVLVINQTIFTKQ